MSGPVLSEAQCLAELRAHARTVVLVGNYGSVNLGDELLLEVMSSWVREAGGEPVAISVHPAHTERTHRLRAVDYADAGAIAQTMAAADLMVMGGGGLFQDYNALDEDALGSFPAFEATQFAQYALLAGTLGVPYAALAQGVGPLRSDSSRRLARHVLASANAASLRDGASAELLRATGYAHDLLVAPDPGWAWQVPGEAISPVRVDAAMSGRPVLAMLLRDWPYDADWEARFVAAFAQAMPRDWACLWIDFHRNPSPAAESGSAIAERMRAQLPGVHAVWRGSRLDEAYALLAGCDAALAMRLHGALLAHRARRPTVTLEYDAKVAALAADLGMPDVQRVPLASIGERLPAAVAAVTGASAFVLPAADAAHQSERALAHRALLWRTMAGVAVAPAPPPRRRWLATWAGAGTTSAPAYVDALEGRVHRLLDRQQMLGGDLERAHESLAQRNEELVRAQEQLAQHADALVQARNDAVKLREELAGVRADASRLREALAQTGSEAKQLAESLAGQTRARDAAVLEATFWRERHDAIQHSRSYRAMTPVRRLAAAWQAWRGRRGEGDE